MAKRQMLGHDFHKGQSPSSQGKQSSRQPFKEGRGEPQNINPPFLEDLAIRGCHYGQEKTKVVDHRLALSRQASELCLVTQGTPAHL
jgi:hypothetical protein